MKVAVIGTGHVGLITGVALSSIGHDVTGVDMNAEKIATLAEGRAPFHEPRVDEMLRDGLAADTLRFTTSIAEAVEGAEVVFICVGRPPVGQGDKSLAAVEDSARELARHAANGAVVVVKSTVPPGTTARIERTIRAERPDLEVDVVSSPEFLREGHAVQDTLEPDRLVVGSDTPRGHEVVRRVYGPILEGRRLIETDPRTAELSKLASNAFLATKISFANGLARVAELAGADVEGVTEIMGADPRIGGAFLGAGLGYGGYCLPKDIATLERVADRLGYDFGLLREVAKINEEALDVAVRKVEEAVWNLEGKRIAMLGLAFKAETDDVRGAPALALARRLLDEGAQVVAYDPMANAEAAREVPSLQTADDPYEAAAGAHALIVATEWPEFAELDLERLKGVMASPVIVDARNILNADATRAAGFTYVPTGRPPDRQA